MRKAVIGDYFQKGMGMPEDLNFTLVREAPPLQEDDDEGVTIAITVNNYRSYKS